MWKFSVIVKAIRESDSEDNGIGALDTDGKLLEVVDI